MSFSGYKFDNLLLCYPIIFITDISQISMSKQRGWDVLFKCLVEWTKKQRSIILVVISADNVWLCTKPLTISNDAIIFISPKQNTAVQVATLSNLRRCVLKPLALRFLEHSQYKLGWKPSSCFLFAFWPLK